VIVAGPPHFKFGGNVPHSGGLPPSGEDETYTLAGTGCFVVGDEKVLAWRELVLLDLGFTDVQRAALVWRADVHLRDVEKWIRHGCPVDVAFEIAL
jgi:hypothetical protein